MALLYLVRSSIVPPLNAGLEGTHHERHMGFWGTSSCDRWSDRVHNLPCRQCWLDGWPRHTRHVTWWQYQISTLSKSVSVLLCFDKCLNAAGSVAVGTNSFTASWPTEHPQQLAACSFATSLSLRQFESAVFIEGSGRNRTHGKPIALFCPLILESWTKPRGSRRVSSWLVSASLSGSGKKLSNACRWWNLRPICDRSLVRLI